MLATYKADVRHKLSLKNENHKFVNEIEIKYKIIKNLYEAERYLILIIKSY